MNQKMEFRFKPVELRFGNNDSGEMTVSGYVNLTEQFSNILRTQHSNHQFIEKIEKGAFRRALERSDEIDFLAEHNSDLILSTTRNNTLSLKEDDRGLFMSAKICPTSWGKDYYTLVKDGILQNFSFGFRALEDEWKDRPDGLLERTIKDMELFEVSVVRNPAYPQSNIQARNLDIVTDDELVESAIENREVKPMDKQKLEEEVREDVNQGAETGEEEEADIETLFNSLERTVLALDVKIEKLYDMVEEVLVDYDRENMKDKENEEPVEDKATDDKSETEEGRSQEEESTEVREQPEEESTETEEKDDAVETEDTEKVEEETEENLDVDDTKEKEKESDDEEVVDDEEVESKEEPEPVEDDKKEKVIEELNRLKDIINNL